jgi:hypothetical protein
MSLERVVDCAAGASPLEVAHHIQRTSGSSDDSAIETLLAAANQTIHPSRQQG